MHFKFRSLTLLLLAALLASCESNSTPARPPGFELKILVGSALGKLCHQSMEQFNQTQPKLPSGESFYATCAEMGSGDIVTSLLTQADQIKQGTLSPDAAELPSLISVDGEIYQSQLIDGVNQRFPGQNSIPAITDSPLIANSPMVLMVPESLANALKVDDPFKVIAGASTFQSLNSALPPQPIRFVQTAPTQSNSGLQTLVAQYAEVSNKRPEQLTIADIDRYQSQVKQIQAKVTRYGASTNGLAMAMAKNGSYWANVGSVYESSVIAANQQRPTGQEKFVAVYPRSTFSSNMRAMALATPWVNANEAAASQQVIQYLLSNPIQQLAAELGLRPGQPGIALGPKFSANAGVMAQPKYDSYRPPKSTVVAHMLNTWQAVSKKPSRTLIIVDTSGSMSGTKLAAVQQALQHYVKRMGVKEELALMNFSSQIHDPTLITNNPSDRQKAIAWIGALQASGDTKLYDAVQSGRNWLQQNPRSNAINAIVVLTDGQDTDSQISLGDLQRQLKASGFASDLRISVFTIGYGSQGEFNETILKQIAEGNGGYFSQGTLDSINQIISNIQTEF